jgi:hypothetical protein
VPGAGASSDADGRSSVIAPAPGQRSIPATPLLARPDPLRGRHGLPAVTVAPRRPEVRIMIAVSASREADHAAAGGARREANGPRTPWHASHPLPRCQASMARGITLAASSVRRRRGSSSVILLRRRVWPRSPCHRRRAGATSTARGRARWPGRSRRGWTTCSAGGPPPAGTAVSTAARCRITRPPVQPWGPCSCSGRWSGCRDSNAGPPEPHSGALPSCATPRRVLTARLSGSVKSPY